MKRRPILRATAAAALLAAGGHAMAQAFGSSTVRLIVAFAPGGQSDLVARLLARTLSSLIGATIVVENRAGAGGAIGVEFAARANADGSTLLLGSASNLTIGPALESNLRYDPIRDFAPIGRIAHAPLVVAARSGLPVASATELVAMARRQPGALTYASGAALVQFAFESLKNSAGVDLVAVPYKGTAPALLDVVAGRVDLIVADVAAVAPHVNAGTLRVIANAGRTRARAFPRVPTMIEQGFDFEFESWQGLLAPRATPANVIARLQGALAEAMAADEFIKGLQAIGFEPIDEPPAAFGDTLRSELDRYRRLVRRQRDAALKTDPVAADRQMN